MGYSPPANSNLQSSLCFLKSAFEAKTRNFRKDSQQESDFKYGIYKN